MENNVRARTAASSSSSEKIQNESESENKAESNTKREPPITALDIVRLVFGLLAVSVLLSYFITGNSFTWGYSPWWLRARPLMSSLKPSVNLSDRELLRYDGSDPALPIYLGLNGTIYDVTAGKSFYGPDGMYSHFAGRDAARAFVTGCFADDSNPDLRGVEWTYVPKDVPREAETTPETAEARAYREAMLVQAHAKVAENLEGWAKLFRGETGKDYFQVGRIRRPKNFLQKEPIKTLCDRAERVRPRTNLEN